MADRCRWPNCPGAAPCACANPQFAATRCLTCENITPIIGESWCSDTCRTRWSFGYRPPSRRTPLRQLVRSGFDAAVRGAVAAVTSTLLTYLAERGRTPGTMADDA